ncbi:MULTISPECIES: META domain-containing protein [unclassified Arthrobacter]|uniref:META domain-containing protein n=1 Tax=unclassified Arthrobacter TaxID=235627 RepID=UPI001E323E1C|nr:MULTISPECIES: META domain-containing protein [unclassified Arthrobacter]MCC9144539.1 META domain-containing protein [Arthrobacter sp. zg-Y919]MDK1275765.1 META domain-containing protein [Arthrobacter sp. zg.Y919]WIB04602.1 META domain-containing protein [Arthrobacter sp. zg-Y919]
MRPALVPVLLPALLVVLLLGACGNDAGASPDPGESGDSPAADVTGAWGDVENPDAPSLDFSPDGRVSGTDGCNRLMGHWSISGNRVSLRDMATTLMACPPGMDTWLSAGAAADVDGGTLRIYDQAGTEIGVLHR